MISAGKGSSERDVQAELSEVLGRMGPRLQAAIKRAFTNIAIQEINNNEHHKPETLNDVSYSSKNTQVNLQRIEMTKSPSFHVTSVSLDLTSHALELCCSIGEPSLRALYSAYNENLYNLIPIMAEGHVLVSLSNMCASVRTGLAVEEDSLTLVSPIVDFTYDEVQMQLSWPSPKRTGGYEFTTTEQIAKHMDELPLTASLLRPLHAFLRKRLLDHLQLVLRETVGVSHMLGCDEALVHAYSAEMHECTELGARALDALLINVRRTLLQNARETLQLPALHASFVHSLGPISLVGRFETDEGWVRNLASVDRRGPVSVYRERDKVTLTATLHISDLNIGFDSYRTKLPGLARCGRVLVRVENNSLLLSVTAGLAHKGQSYAQLDTLAVQNFGSLDVHVTGLGPLSRLGAVTGSWLEGHAHAHAIPAIERQLADEMHRAFAEIDLWQLVQPKRANGSTVENGHKTSPPTKQSGNGFAFFSAIPSLIPGGSLSLS